MKKKLLCVMLASAMAASLLAGCGGKSENGSTTAAGGGAAAGAKVLNIAAQDPQVPLDMQLNTYSLIMKMTDNIVETLITPDQDGNLQPTLLTEMPALSEDKLSYSFTLKEGVKFHNGETLTSGDVKYSMERLVKKLKMGSLLEKVEGYDAFNDGQAEEITGIKVVDDTHFTIQLASVYTPFVSVLSTPYAAIYPAKACEEAGDDWGLKVLYGTGPFTFDHYTTGVDCTINKFAEYHGTTALLDTVNFKFIDDSNTQVMEYQKGTVDMLELDASLYPTYANNAELKDQMFSYQQLGGQYMTFNVNDIPDVKVREAISLAIDRKAICESIVHGTATASSSFLPKGLIGHDESAQPFEYNPEKAKQLLAEAGYPDGYTLELFANSKYPETIKMATAIQAQAIPAGITVNINQVDSSAWTDMKKNGKVVCGIGSWYVDYSDPDSMLYPVSDGRVDLNSSFWHNAEFKKLMDEGVQTDDQDKRQEIYKKAEHILTREDFAVAPIFNETSFYLLKPYVTGCKITNEHRTFLAGADIVK